MKNDLKVCPQCGFDTFKEYVHNSSWVSMGDTTHALHVSLKSPAVILTTDGWYCRMCRCAWKDSDFEKYEG